MTTTDRVPGRPTILVIEDDDLPRARLVDRLDGERHRVVSAGHGRYAVEHRPQAAGDTAHAAADASISQPVEIDVHPHQVEVLAPREAGACPLVASA